MPVICTYVLGDPPHPHQQLPSPLRSSGRLHTRLPRLVQYIFPAWWLVNICVSVMGGEWLHTYICLPGVTPDALGLYAPLDSGRTRLIDLYATGDTGSGCGSHGNSSSGESSCRPAAIRWPEPRGENGCGSDILSVQIPHIRSICFRYYNSNGLASKLLR